MMIFSKKSKKKMILLLTYFVNENIIILTVATQGCDSIKNLQFFDRIGKERIEQVRFYERRR